MDVKLGEARVTNAAIANKFDHRTCSLQYFKLSQIQGMYVIVGTFNSAIVSYSVSTQPTRPSMALIGSLHMFIYSYSVVPVAIKFVRKSRIPCLQQSRAINALVAQHFTYKIRLNFHNAR